MPGRTIAVTVGSTGALLTGSRNDPVGVTDTATGSLVGSGSEPTRANTGPASGTTFTTISGDVVLTDGQVLTAKHITGNVFHNGNGAGLTDCIVDGGVFPNTTNFGIANNKNGLTCLRCDIGGVFNTSGLNNCTFDTCHIGQDGIDDTVMQIADGNGEAGTAGAVGLKMYRNRVYGRPDIARYGAGDPHWEAIHLGGVLGFDIQGNTFDFQPRFAGDSGSMSHITAVVTFEKTFSGSSRNDGCSGTFSGNWIKSDPGEDYALYCNLIASSPVQNNVFTGGGGVTVSIPAPSYTATGNTRNGSPYSF